MTCRRWEIAPIGISTCVQFFLLALDFVSLELPIARLRSVPPHNSAASLRTFALASPHALDPPGGQ